VGKSVAMKRKKTFHSGEKSASKVSAKRRRGVGSVPDKDGASSVVFRPVVRSGAKLTQQQLEAHLWGAANILRGKTAGQDYKNYILSLMFYKRLCDQWENEADEAILELERQQGRPFTEKQKAIFRARGEHRFKIPQGSRWGDVLAVAENIGEKLTNAMRAVANANDELRGVFTVDWNQPAPDASGKKLIPNEVVHALIQHFDEVDLSNKSVPPDVLGRAYEYLIKQFADDAGAKAGEFFTPPEVVDILVRILQPAAGDTIYDPTCGSGGMLIHSADFLREHGENALAARYFGQEMNWGNYAIGKINSVLHGLEADIRGGASTITDPQFLEHATVKKFSLVLANFPFSDEFWWLKPEQKTDDKKKRDKLKKEIFGKEGYKDRYGRFGRGAAFHSPAAAYGDYAFILHILASLNQSGRAGIVCPQGVLFRGQPEVEEETAEFDDDGNPIIKRRKADDEHLIREALVESRVIDAVISLPLNVFYGAGVPACLSILNKERPAQRRDKLLLVYAARHFRELSNQNELRPQDVMRILVHYHAYGDASQVPQLVGYYTGRVRDQINEREMAEVERLEAEYKEHSDKLATLDTDIASLRSQEDIQKKIADGSSDPKLDKLNAIRTKLVQKVVERDDRIAEVRHRAEEDREAVAAVGVELGTIYANPNELAKHARVVSIDEIRENEFNLNIPRYVDTFEPEPKIEVKDALSALRAADEELTKADDHLKTLLQEIGYAH
jgi:type I restriction enzyme M protein